MSTAALAGAGHRRQARGVPISRPGRRLMRLWAPCAGQALPTATPAQQTNSTRTLELRDVGTVPCGVGRSGGVVHEAPMARTEPPPGLAAIHTGGHARRARRGSNLQAADPKRPPRMGAHVAQQDEGALQGVLHRPLLARPRAPLVVLLKGAAPLVADDDVDAKEQEHHGKQRTQQQQPRLPLWGRGAVAAGVAFQGRVRERGGANRTPWRARTRGGPSLPSRPLADWLADSR